ncbi:MAG: methylated-DNA--[protein]-cysteine S-methyltransferase [Verrucomicrobia bacterium]|nr:methylated-DNA--[protein]-cysteine S-methyltransferase [Verrucomicrobiota bacterium]
MKRISKSDNRLSSRPLEIKTTWGVITLMLNDKGKAVALNFPYLGKAPSEPFSMEKFQTLEDLVRNFPSIGKLAGTGFQQDVWTALRKIPRGQTRTYGEISAAIGKPKAVRAVGTACGANPLPVFIPCHRVVAKNGLGGFGSGLPWKTLLLKMEGAL